MSHPHSSNFRSKVLRIRSRTSHKTVHTDVHESRRLGVGPSFGSRAMNFLGTDTLGLLDCCAGLETSGAAAWTCSQTHVFGLVFNTKSSAYCRIWNLFGGRDAVLETYLQVSTVSTTINQGQLIKSSPDTASPNGILINTNVFAMLRRVEIYRRFRGGCCLHHSPDDGGSNHL
jgi:hypothetical protein